MLKEGLKSLAVVCIVLGPVFVALGTLRYMLARDGLSAALVAVLGTGGWLLAQYLTRPGTWGGRLWEHDDFS